MGSALICDYVGRVKTALSKRLPVPFGPLEIEVKAIEEGILFAWDVGICDVVVECNSDFFHLCLGKIQWPVIIATIIEGIHQKLQDFRQVQISFEWVKSSSISN